jgi:serine/threonine protein kinase
VPRCLNCAKALGNWQFHRYNVRVIPSHIGQYRIIRKIGAGGMGMVFLGEHMLLGRRAAIKTLLPTVAIHREIVERFFNEARATSAISDPGVIQIFDFGYHVDGTAYIVMELLEGEALSARIDRLGRLALADALRIARQIAGSLAAAHARGIVHRDLKPENIFLVSDPEAQCGERTKILDFGICKTGLSDATVTESGAMIGTPVYMSPEQCRGARSVDHRADIYAFGCLLFYMITGRPPFEAEAPGELIVAHLNATPVPPSHHVAGLPQAIDALLLRCLAKSPDERFQSMLELQLAVGELYAQLDHSDPTVGAARPAMLLGRGFRSIYDASGGVLSGALSRRTPVTDRLGAKKWFERSPGPQSPQSIESTGSPGPTGSAPGPRSEPEELDDLDADLDVPPRRSSARVALASIAVVAVVLGLVATSFVTYGDRDAEDRPAIPQAALPIERAPAQPVTAGATTPANPPVGAAPREPREQIAAPSPAAPRAVAAEVPREVEEAPSATPEAPRDAGDAPAAPAATAEVPREIEQAPSAPPRLAASPPARSREIKKPAARPRSRPVSVTPRTPSAPSEDLYDTR